MVICIYFSINCFNKNSKYMTVSVAVLVLCVRHVLLVHIHVKFMHVHCVETQCFQPGV
jgi:hypothetical protein